MTYIKVIQGQPGNNKILLEDRITPQDRYLDIFIISNHDHHFQKIFDIVGKISKMQLTELNYKPLEGPNIRDLIDLEIVALLYLHLRLHK